MMVKLYPRPFPARNVTGDILQLNSNEAYEFTEPGFYIYQKLSGSYMLWIYDPSLNEWRYFFEIGHSFNLLPIPKELVGKIKIQCSTPGKLYIGKVPLEKLLLETRSIGLDLELLKYGTVLNTKGLPNDHFYFEEPGTYFALLSLGTGRNYLEFYAENVETGESYKIFSEDIWVGFIMLDPYLANQGWRYYFFNNNYSFYAVGYIVKLKYK